MYPVAFELDYVQKRSRLTTFFRYLLAIPHFFFFMVYFVVFYFVLIVAWFALLFTARWPQGLYNFSCGFLRYSARFSAYLNLAVDPYPPFSGAEDTTYPARVLIAPPLERYSRLKVFFRPIYSILALVIRYALGIVLSFVAFIAWCAIVVTGKQPASLQNALKFSLGYTVKSDALLFLITETYPPFGEEPTHAVTA